MTQPNFLTLAQAARVLGIPYSHMQHKLHRANIRATEIHGTNMLTLAEVARLEDLPPARRYRKKRTTKKKPTPKSGSRKAQGGKP